MESGDPDERYAYQTFALLSALSVVSEWAETRRLSGTPLDPTTLEPAPQARREALSDAAVLSALAYRLKTAEIASATGEASLAYRMNRALLLRRMGRASARLHQRLMSLFPLIEAELVERARELEQIRRHLAVDGDVASYADTCLGLAHQVEQQLVG
jgi:hypothetical protein